MANRPQMALLALLLAACSPTPEPRAVRATGSSFDGDVLSATQALLSPAPPSVPNRVGTAAGDTHAPSPTGEATRAPIFGRVIDIRTGRGRPDLRVVFQISRNQKQEAESDEEGRFAFVPAAAVESARIGVQPRRGWRWLAAEPGHSVPLTPAQFAGEDEVILEIAERRRGTATGIAVDATHGNPLPHFRFSISFRPRNRSKPVTVEIETDDQGHFESSEEILGGQVAIRSAVGEGWPTKKEQDCLINPLGNEAWRIEFNVLPRMEVKLVGAVPENPKRFHFWILRPEKQSPPRELTSSTLAKAAWVKTNRKSSRPLTTTDLRRDTDGSLWVRPPSIRTSPCPQEPFLFAIGSDDGLLFAALPVRWADGFGSETIVFDLRRTAVLELEVESESASPTDSIFDGPHWRVASQLSEDRPATPMAGASFRIQQRKWLSPGNYQLRVSSRLHSTVETTLLLEAGQIQAILVPLVLRPNTRTVRGRLVMETGASLIDANVGMSLVEDPLAIWRATYSVELLDCGTGIDHFASRSENGKAGTFIFERVCAGEVRFSVHAGFFPAQVDLSESDSGDLDALITILDRQDAPGLGFRVLSPPGLKKKTFQVGTRLYDEGSALPFRATDGAILLRENPAQRKFEWAAWYGGYLPVYGTASDFVSESGERFFAPLKLMPGWGTRVLVHDSSGQPFAGAEVRADGESLGVTDGSGKFDISRSKRPASLEVLAPGWAPRAGYFPRPSTPWYEVRLVRSDGN